MSIKLNKKELAKNKTTVYAVSEYWGADRLEKEYFLSKEEAYRVFEEIGHHEDHPNSDIEMWEGCFSCDIINEEEIPLDELLESDYSFEGTLLAKRHPIKQKGGYLLKMKGLSR